MILVTGAAGKTGLAVIRALVRRRVAVRALVRRPAAVAAVTAAGAAETVIADFNNARALRRAARGVTAIYHICPNVSAQEVAIGRKVIAAARAAGAALVYHSVLHPQTRTMPHHIAKLRVEELIIDSGLPFTIIQPGPYMQNLQGVWQSIAGAGIIPVPYPVDARFSMVDLEDIACVAARVLTGQNHRGAIYELAGPALSTREMAAIAGRILRRPVRARRLALAEWTKQAHRAGQRGYPLTALQKMFRYYEKHGLVGNPRVLRSLLGRPPAALPAVLRRLAAANGAAA